MAFEDRIRIRGIALDCVVGVYPHERDMPQPLEVDLDLILDAERAGAQERLRHSVDYASVTAQVGFLLTSCRFRMLETAALALCRWLLATPALGEQRAPIERARVKLTKPAALDGLAIPSLEVERDAAWASFATEHKPFGIVDVLHETSDAGIYRLNVAPGARIPLHVHRRMQESEMVLSEGLLCQNRPVAPGTVHRWPLDAPHCYENVSDAYATILCVDSPPFDEADEVQVQGEPADVAPESVAAWMSHGSLQ